MARPVSGGSGAGAGITRLRENLGKMGVVVVTGSAGLIGAEAVRFLARQGFDVVGIDNDMRRVFFGNEASTAWSRQRLEIEVKGYRHIDGDIRDAELVNAT